MMMQKFANQDSVSDMPFKNTMISLAITYIHCYLLVSAFLNGQNIKKN